VAVAKIDQAAIPLVEGLLTDAEGGGEPLDVRAGKKYMPGLAGAASRTPRAGETETLGIERSFQALPP
jgi:hypothetical protein